jgi:hypothetical protein
MNKLKMILPLALLASCNSYYFPLWVETPQRIISSFKPYSPGDNYIQNQQYSFITVELGQQNATMVLNSIDDNIFTWVGRDNVTFRTYKGLIIDTVGLEHNFEIINAISSIDKLLDDGDGGLSYNFDNPRLYELEATAVKSFESLDRLEIALVSNDINWNIDLEIAYGSRGLPTKVQQSLHPFLKPAKIHFYYKY